MERNNDNICAFVVVSNILKIERTGRNNNISIPKHAPIVTNMKILADRVCTGTVMKYANNVKVT